ncbi:MAG: peptidase inhibitor family I36 protein [Actinoallomurus sp.]
MRKTISVGSVLAVAAAVSLLGGTTAQAYAATPKPKPRGHVTALDNQTCPTFSGVACFWPGISRTGTRGTVSGDNADYKKLSNSSGCSSGTWNDCIRSAANGGNRCVIYFWTGANYTGRYHSLAPGDSMDAFGIDPWNDPSFADAISSNHWCSSGA